MSVRPHELREQTKSQFKILRRKDHDYNVEWHDPTADEALSNVRGECWQAFRSQPVMTAEEFWAGS